MVEENAAHRGLDHFVLQFAVGAVYQGANLDVGIEVYTLFVVGDVHFLRRVEGHAFALHGIAGKVALRLGHVVQTQDHVLRRYRDRRTVRGVQDVVRGQHQDLSFQDSGRAQGQVHRHLVTVKVRVEGRTGQGVQLDSLSLNHLRLEGLDTQAVQRRSTVQKNGVALHDVFQDVPYNGFALVDDLLRRLHRFHDSALDQLANDKGFVELSGHILGKTTFVELQIRTDNDDRTCRIVYTLTQQVLTEAALLAFQAVAQRLQRTVALRLHGAGLAGVVKQAVYRLLQHALFVAQDDLGGLDLQQTLQTVVADDHTAVEVVQVRRSEATTVQGHQGAQFGRDDGNYLDDHPLGLVFQASVGIAHSFHHLQTLEGFLLALLRGFAACTVAQVVGHGVQVQTLQQHQQRFSAHFGDELVGVVVVQVLVFHGQAVQGVEVLLFGQELHVLKGIAFVVYGLTRLNDDVTLVVNDHVQLLRGDAQEVTQLVGQ